MNVMWLCLYKATLSVGFASSCLPSSGLMRFHTKAFEQLFCVIPDQTRQDRQRRDAEIPRTSLAKGEEIKLMIYGQDFPYSYNYQQY